MTAAATISLLGPALKRLSHQYPILTAKRAGSELFGAPRLNAFSLFQPNEVRLSRVIADLFDPRGTHGQDILFLNALLRILELPRVSIIEPVTVRREMMTHAGRQIDLVIETPRMIIGIENKPWAAQQPDQLSDYLAALRAWCRGRTPVLIFLSNMEPETARDDVRVVRLHSADEPSLTHVLSDCQSGIRATRTQTHVAEMIAYLASEFGDKPMMADADSAYVEAVEAEYERGPDNRRALAMTMLAQTRLHAILLNEIADRIFGRAHELFDDVILEDEDCPLSEALGDKHNWWGFRRPSWPENCSVAISPGRTNFGEVFFGVHAPNPNNRSVDKEDGCASWMVISQAVATIEGGSSEAWWPWWKWAEPRTWNAGAMASLLLESPTGLVGDHPQVQEMIDRMLALASAIDASLRSK